MISGGRSRIVLSAEDAASTVGGAGVEPGQVAELIVTRADGTRSRGSGYRTASATVLTAAHVVADAVAVVVRFDADLPTEWSAAGRTAARDDAADVAVVVLDIDRAPPVRRAEFGRVGPATAPVDVVAVGFPLFKRRTGPVGTASRFRETHQAFGMVAPLSNRRTPTYEVTVAPPAPSLDARTSPWEGMSGSALWAAGRIVGVVTDHHGAEGPGRLAAARVDRVLDRGVRAALGLPEDPSRLPDVTSTGRGGSYRHHVLDIAPVVLRDRDVELAQLAAATEPYSWWEAPPWAGKTALMSWFVLHPPPDVDVVPFFVSAGLAGRSDSDAFLDVVAEQLTALAGQPRGAPATTATRRGRWLALLEAAAARSREAGRALLLVVDALDEDSGATAHRPSIAGLLPRRPVNGVRVVVTSRPGSAVPHDVAPDHPLRCCVRRSLAPSPHARADEESARYELAAALASGAAAEDLLGLIAASGGGLDLDDLAELTDRTRAAVEQLLLGALGRSICTRRRPPGVDGGGPSHAFAHETLRQAATEQLGPRLGHYRRLLDAWCDRYRGRGWPEGTPAYLLSGHARRLAADGDTARLGALATDVRRHDRMREVLGGDAPALDEIALAHEALQVGGRADLTAAALLAVRREDLTHRNRHVPPELPAVWAAIGRTGRAEALARGLPERRRTAALAGVAVAAAGSDGELAERLAVELDQGDERSAATLGEVAVGLARHDAGRAARILARLPRRRRGTVLLRIAAGAGVRDLQEVETLVVSAGSGDDRVVAARAVLAAAAGDMRRAEEQLSAVTDPADRARIRTALAGAAARAGRFDLGDRVAGRLPAPRRGPALIALLQAAVMRADDHEIDRFTALVRKTASQGRADDAVVLLITAARALDGPPGTAPGSAPELRIAAESIVDAVAVTRHRDRALGRLAAAYAAGGDWSGAEQALDRVHAVDLLHDGLEGMAVAAAALDPDRAEAAVRRITASRRRTAALTSVAAALAEHGEWDRAARIADEVEHVAGSVPASARAAVLTAPVAVALAVMGDPDTAVALADALPDRTRRCAVLVDVVEVLAESGDADAAGTVAELVADRGRRAWALVSVAEALAAAGRGTEARSAVAEARSSRIDDLATRALALGRLARVAAVAGDPRTARELVDEARRIIAADPEECAAAAVHVAAAEAATGPSAVGGQDLLRDTGPPRRDRVRVGVVRALLMCGATAAAATLAEQVVEPASRVAVLAAVARASVEPATAVDLLRRAGSAAGGLDGDSAEAAAAGVRVAVATERVLADHPGIDAGLELRLPRTVLGLLGTEGWHEIVPVLARLDPAAVRLIADWLAHRLQNLHGFSADR